MWPNYNMRELSSEQHMLANVTGRTEDFQLVSESLVPGDIWNGRDNRTVVKSVPVPHTRQKTHKRMRRIWCLERVFMDEGLGIPLGLSDSQCLPTSDAFKPACAVSSPAHPPSLAPSSSPFFQGTNQGHIPYLLVLTGIASHCSLPLPFQPVGMNHTLTKSSRGERSMRPDGAPWNPNRGLSAQNSTGTAGKRKRKRGVLPFIKHHVSKLQVSMHDVLLQMQKQRTVTNNLTINIAVYYRKMPCTIIQLNLGWTTQ